VEKNRRLRGCRRLRKKVDFTVLGRRNPEEETLTVDEILRRGYCKPIRGCPGRWILSEDERLDPGTLAGRTGGSRRFRRDFVPDEIWVCALRDGGLISYRKPDGRFVHTVCDSEGFLRKLSKLDIAREDVTMGG